MPRPKNEDAHFRVLRLLEQNPELSQRDVAEALGVSLGAANYVLRALVEKGQVKVQNFRAADNKLRYAYILTPRGMSRTMLKSVSGDAADLMVTQPEPTGQPAH